MPLSAAGKSSKRGTPRATGNDFGKALGYKDTVHPGTQPSVPLWITAELAEIAENDP
jgi:hypothetical protein